MKRAATMVMSGIACISMSTTSLTLWHSVEVIMERLHSRGRAKSSPFACPAKRQALCSTIATNLKLCWKASYCVYNKKGMR
eukprot:6461280-Amphidinium_carterae.1